MSATIFAYNKYNYETIDEKLKYFEYKIHRPSIRYFIAKDLLDLHLLGAMNFKQTLYSLQILTNTFQISQKVNGYKDQGITSVAGSLLMDLVRLDPADDYMTKANSRTSEYRDPSNLDLYWKEIESLIAAHDVEVDNETTSQLKIYGESARDIRNRLPDWMNSCSYNGYNLRISGNVAKHKSSVAILPSNPKNAITALFEDEARTIFAEYGEDSAENAVETLFGTDGAYANHYRTFLNFEERYPNQKSLLFK